MISDNSIFYFEHYSFTYSSSGKKILTDINTDLPIGNNLLILGANASGKSTFLKMIVGHADEGEAQGIFSSSAKRILHVEQRLRHSFLYPMVEQELELALLNNQSFTGDIKARINEVLLFFNWQDFCKKRVDLLSHTEQALLTFLSASLYVEGQSDAILLLDELHENVSSIMWEQILKWLTKEFADLSVILTSSQLESIPQHFFDKVILLEGGSIFFEGSLLELCLQKKVEDHGVHLPFAWNALQLAKIPIRDYLPSLWRQDTWLDQGWIPLLHSWFEAQYKRELICSTDDYILEIDKLSFSYPHMSWRLQDISLSLRSGDIIAITGASGSGKTTLGLLLASILKPKSMRIRFDQKETKSSNLLLTDIFYVGTIFEDTYSSYDLWYWLEDMVPQKNFVKQLDWEHLKEVLKVCLPEQLNALSFRREQARSDVEVPSVVDIRTLNHSERCLLPLVVGLLYEPKVLILDNISCFQDFQQTKRIMDFVFYLSRRWNGSTILLTQNIPLSLRYSSQIYFLYKGRLSQSYLPSEAFADLNLLEKNGLLTNDKKNVDTFFNLMHKMQFHNPQAYLALFSHHQV